MQTNIRQSGIELLRIISMLFILLGHTFFMMNSGIPDIHINIFPFSFCSFIGAVGIGGVNAFVLISGWFGIHFKIKGLIKLLFEFFFLVWGLWIVALLCNKTTINGGMIKGFLGTINGYWFVFAYIGLYILSPILNSFVEHTSKKELASLLIVFYTFQCYYTWATDMVNYFNGYGITFFCGLYLTARYFRKYPIELFTKHSFAIFIIATLLITIILVVGYYFVGNALRMSRYDNPLVITAAMAIVITFSKFTFHSRIINWLAASAFAVYIIHFHPFIFPYYSQGLHYCLSNISTYLTIPTYCFYIIGIYIACTLIDQIRIVAWKSISQFIKK